MLKLFKKTLILLFILSLFSCDIPEKAPKWYEIESDLQSKSIKEWKQATYEIQLVASLNILSNLKKAGHLKSDVFKDVSSINDTRPLAEALTKCINTVVKNQPDNMNIGVSEAGISCLLLMNWLNDK